ncbi:hypothetical protein GGS23DRAFT_569040 [Durotheca rogersii]|uniref:uncharacterized protein n=1 Tax=Durotheca rogersii TaxID=419775 RepID=UPI002220CF52|nr:uncharacterized protein GGS23DRAFT_569040 [Durotheca rogersii]KAI5863274.1 hypothetical protein GGS23DRAFT_569040 [Durotheca rogersii]
MERTQQIEILTYLSWWAFELVVDPVYDHNRPWIKAVGSKGFYFQTYILHIPPPVGFFSSDASSRQGAEACFFLWLAWMWMSILILVLVDRGAWGAEIQRLKTAAAFASMRRFFPRNRKMDSRP